VKEEAAMVEKKKAYSTPRLTEYGDARKITQNGSFPNADQPQGNNNTANEPGSA
jgi:hypothetical protein